MAVITGRPFGLAFCKHFGLDPAKVTDSIKLHTATDEIFGVTFSMTLSAEDIESIGKLMKE